MFFLRSRSLKADRQARKYVVSQFAMPMLSAMSVKYVLMFACVVLLAHKASAQPRPRMPEQWRCSWEGRFTYCGCVFGGYMYYNNELQLLRTDELFAWNATAACNKVLGGFVYQQAFNLYPDGLLNTYFIPPGDTALTCMSTTLPYWWDANYLEEADYVGTDTIEGQDVYVYNSTDLFLNGYVLTYIAKVTESYYGMRVVQDPVFFEDYTVIFTSGLIASIVDRSAFTLPDMPCTYANGTTSYSPKLWPFGLLATTT